MKLYAEQLADRCREALALEQVLVNHFGKEAEDCENWQELWSHGWREELANPGPTDTYQPKGVPRDEEGYIIGGWVGEKGFGFADEPDLYSDKLPFVLARDLASGSQPWIAKVLSLLSEADEIDCDQLLLALDTLTTYLSSYTLRWIQGTGHELVVGNVESDNFFRAWNEKKKGSGLFICRLGIAVPGKPIIPSGVATNALEIAKRQIESRRRELRIPIGPTPDFSTSTPSTTPHPLSALLLNYTIDQLRELLHQLGVVDSEGQATAAASPGAWVGAIHGLLDARPPHLRGSKAAIRRAFCAVFGADVSERAVQAGLGTNGSEAERFRDQILALLSKG